MNAECCGGYAKHTLYTTKWAEASPNLDPRASNAYMTHPAAGHSLRRFIQNARHGGMICPSRLALFKLRDSDQCGLCAHIHRSRGTEPERGTAGHLTGHCSHPKLVGARIAKHNTAVRIIAECLHHGNNGGGYMIMDATSRADLPEYCAGLRPPSWLCPQISAGDRDRMRPDILFIPKLPRSTAERFVTSPPTDKSAYPVYLIEVGYASDLHHSEKVIQKQAQHAALAAAMRADGWTVHYDTAQIVTLGHGGTIPRTLEPLLKELGVKPQSAKNCCTRLHMHSLTALKGTASLYYKLEQEMGIAHARRRSGSQGGRTQGGATSGPHPRKPG